MSVPPKVKMKSLADYLIRPELQSILAEARADYSQVHAGEPRLLEQKDIAARFRDVRRPKKTVE